MSDEREEPLAKVQSMVDQMTAEQAGTLEEVADVVDSYFLTNLEPFRGDRVHIRVLHIDEASFPPHSAWVELEFAKLEERVLLAGIDLLFSEIRDRSQTVEIRRTDMYGCMLDEPIAMLKVASNTYDGSVRGLPRNRKERRAMAKQQRGRWR